MADLTKQLLLKMAPELEETIDKAFSEYLKLTGKPITKAEYIRCNLNEKCNDELERAKFKNKQKEYMIIYKLQLFISRFGEDLLIQFMRGFCSINKLQTYADLYNMNEKQNIDPIALNRNKFNLFSTIVSEINEFKNPLNEVLVLINKEKRLSDILLSERYKILTLCRREIENDKRYYNIRNKLGFHNGDINVIKDGLKKCYDDGYFILGEALSDLNEGVGRNSVIYNIANLILAGKNINIDKELAKHTLKIMSECIDNFQILFFEICQITLADNLIHRKNV